MPVKRNMDYAAATELELYAQNERECYEMKKPFVLNMARRMVMRTNKPKKFKPSLAWKLWMYYIDRVAAKYCKDFCQRGARVADTFPLAVRQRAARLTAANEAEAIRAGNYGELKNLKHWRL